MTSFFVPFSAKRSNYKHNNGIFSPLRIEAKPIENLLSLGLEDDELHFNKRPEYAYLLIMASKILKTQL